MHSSQRIINITLLIAIAGMWLSWYWILSQLTGPRFFIIILAGPVVVFGIPIVAWILSVFVLFSARKDIRNSTDKIVPSIIFLTALVAVVIPMYYEIMHFINNTYLDARYHD